MPKVSEYASTVGSVSKVKQQLISSGAGKSNVINPERLYDNAANNIEHNVVGGTVVSAPIPINPEAFNFVKSDNGEVSENTKSNSYKVVYYYSTEKSQEIQPPSKELLALPETDPRYQLFIANLAQGIGGGRIIMDSSKEKIPSRGDKVSIQSVKGDHAFSSKVISIDESEDVELSEGEPSLKERSKSGEKVSPDNKNAEVPNTSYDPDKNVHISLPSKMKIKKLPADLPSGYKKGRDGYLKTSLRTDAAEDYLKLYNEVRNLGGVITSAGGFIVKGETSMHSLGLAFDLSLATGMQNIQKDPYLIQVHPVKGKDRWIVWCKTNNPKIPMVNINAVTCATINGQVRLTYTPVNVRAFNFTELAIKYGFTPISAHKGFCDGKQPYTGSEWWHFQYFKPLVKNVSTFGEEALRIFSLQEAQQKLKNWEVTRFYKYKTGYWSD